MKIPFSPPYVDQDVINEVVDTLNSGWITTGPKVKALEDLICEYTGCQAALGVNSWTSGAMLFMKWMGIGPGDEVIVPAYTYSATALSVLNIGATPVMVDCGEGFSISVEGIRKAITSKTKAIMPVDIGGWPCDYDAINALVEEEPIKRQFNPSSDFQKQIGRITVISDAAHSIGASYKGKKTGSLCDVTIFSFHAVKNVTTAEGGAVCLNLPEAFDPDECYRLLRRFALNGQTKDAFTKTTGGWRYDIVEQGMKCNMPDLNAAVGLVQLNKYDTLLKERKKIFEYYEKFFSKKDWAILPYGETIERESSYHLYALRFKDITEDQRDELIDLIMATGVSVNVHFVPMPMFTFFKNSGYDINDYPRAFDQYHNVITLPIYPGLSQDQLTYIVSSIEDSYNALMKKSNTVEL